MNALKFVKQFVHKPGWTGAILPSSSILASMVTECAQVRKADTVVEFGPGTGAITECVLKCLRPGANFFAMEINSEFVEIMRRRFPQVKVHHDSASNTRRYLGQLEISYCDSIVSGLPWTVFNEALQDELLDAVEDALGPGGSFSTYMYINSIVLPAGVRFRAKLRARFGKLNASPMVWRNVPPAVVYSVRK